MDEEMVASENMESSVKGEDSQREEFSSPGLVQNLRDEKSDRKLKSIR